MSSSIFKIVEHYDIDIKGDKICCPFHNEKTPSLQLYEDTESWYCFGSCGEGGDAIDFVKKMEDLDFTEALSRVCEILNISKEEWVESKESGEVKTPIREDNEAMKEGEARAFAVKTGFKAKGYRGIRDEINLFFGHCTKLDNNGNPVARYYPETNSKGEVTGLKCRNLPKDFSHGKIGLTGAKSQLSGQFKFKSPGKYCVPMHTLALTKRGWLNYEEIQVGDMVLGYDQQNKTKKWTKVLHKHFFESQEVFEFGSGVQRMQSTADHRWFVSQRTTESDHSVKVHKDDVRTIFEFTSESHLIVNARMDENINKAGIASLSPNKYQTDWVSRVLEMTQEQRIAFLDGFLIADGHHNGSYWMGSQNDGNVFEGALLASYLVHDKIIRVKSRKVNSKGNVMKDIVLSNSKHRTRLNENIVSLGEMSTWCITTELDSWVIRQGDLITITGNCLIVGGEEDKAASYQMLKDSQREGFSGIAVVSPTAGENTAAKQCAAQYDFLDMFDIIIIGMDNDDAGNKAAEAIAKVLPKEKIRIAKWSAKDPNKMLIDGLQNQFVRDFYNAKEVVRSGICSAADADGGIDEFLTAPKIGLPPQLHRLQAAMRGGIRSTGAVVNIIGDTSIGKSFLSDTLLYEWIFNSPLVPTVVSLERTKEELTIDLLSMHLKKNLMWFKDGHDAVEYLHKPEVIELKNNLLYNEEGKPRFFIIDEREGEIELLKRQMEKSGKVNDSTLMVIDPLTDFLRSLGTEVQENFMMWQKLMKKNGYVFINILHTRKPPTDKDGNVRKVTEYDALGSGTFIQSADINIVINRDKMSSDPIEKNTTYVDMPKCRGGVTGEICALYYDAESRQQYDRDDYFNQRNTTDDSDETPPQHHFDEVDF